MVALNSADFANEPNENYPEDDHPPPQSSRRICPCCSGTVGTIDYGDEEDDAIMAAEEEIEVDVALDSGCVCHVVKPGDVPAGVAVT